LVRIPLTQRRSGAWRIRWSATIFHLELSRSRGHAGPSPGPEQVPADPEVAEAVAGCFGPTFTHPVA